MISIKLKRISKKKNLIFHIIVISNNKFIEKIGYYKPIADHWGNKYFYIDIDKFLYWLRRGAVTSRIIFTLIRPLLLFYKD